MRWGDVPKATSGCITAKESLDVALETDAIELTVPAASTIICLSVCFTRLNRSADGNRRRLTSFEMYAREGGLLWGWGTSCALSAEEGAEALSVLGMFPHRTQAAGSSWVEVRPNTAGASRVSARQLGGSKAKRTLPQASKHNLPKSYFLRIRVIFLKNHTNFTLS